MNAPFKTEKKLAPSVISCGQHVSDASVKSVCPDQSVYDRIPGMAYRALLSSWLARNVTASVWDLWDWTNTTQINSQTTGDSDTNEQSQWWWCVPITFPLIALHVKTIKMYLDRVSTSGLNFKVYYKLSNGRKIQPKDRLHTLIKYLSSKSVWGVQLLGLCQC